MRKLPKIKKRIKPPRQFINSTVENMSHSDLKIRAHVDVGARDVPARALAGAELRIDDRFGTPEVWHGFNDVDQEGVWGWVDGSPVNYTNWRDGYKHAPSIR